MKHIIYYFSGTGNSMRTAVRIAEKSEAQNLFPFGAIRKRPPLKTPTSSALSVLFMNGTCREP